jgi:two-component system NtrC family sensor kinase
MFRFPTSIRQKVTIGYYFLFAFMSGVAVFIYSNLMNIENKFFSTEQLHDLFDMTLEIRRYEKNYFLYKQNEDYIANQRLVNEAEGFIEKNKEEFTSRFTSEPWVSNLQDALKEYRQLMEEVLIAKKHRNPEDIIILEEKIRKDGKKIVNIMENISKTEHKNIQASLFLSRRILLISLASLGLLGIILGQVLSRLVVRPLSLLEESMDRIADGKFDKVSIDSSDKEILSFSNAFNRMIKELELRQRHLVQSAKLASLGTMLSGVAHELNNPISNISSSCQILQEEIEDGYVDYKKDLLSQIEEQTERMRNIVRSLLEFSRAKEFKKEPLSLKKLIEDTVRLIRGQKPATVEIAIDIPENIIINADSQRLQQAFLNLIKNSIEAMAEGKITINAWRDIRLDTANIKFSDTGVGISAEDIQKIFDPFFTTKETGKGTGLGLFITYEIIEEHGGSIKVESKVGEGTTFLIELPLRGV